MIREICRDPFFLARKSEPATADDLGVAQDLLDTLAAHREGCVGMAANMIGVGKRIIAFESDGAYAVVDCSQPSLIDEMPIGTPFAWRYRIPALRTSAS